MMVAAIVCSEKEWEERIENTFTIGL